MLAYIWAEDENQNIGVNGHLPWHLPADLKHFKEETLNHPMIMGKKTFMSLPGILPQRHHVVLTHSKLDVDQSEVTVVHSKKDLDQWIGQQDPCQLIFIIGGATLFEMYKDEVDYLYRTTIHQQYDADTKMPLINYENFEIISYQQFEQQKPSFEFITYKRI